MYVRLGSSEDSAFCFFEDVISLCLLFSSLPAHPHPPLPPVCCLCLSVSLYLCLSVSVSLHLCLSEFVLFSVINVL